MRKMEKKIPRKLQKSLSNVICRIRSQAPNLHIASTTSKLINGCRHPMSLPIHAAGHRPRRRKSNLSDQQESETTASESAGGGGQSDKAAAAATLEDIDQFLFENFRSLYCDDDDEEEDEEEESGTPATFDTSESSFETPDLTPGSFCESRRFFISSASTGSLIEEARSSRANSDDAVGISSTITAASAGLKPLPAIRALEKKNKKKKKSAIPSEAESALESEDCVAVLKASADPCEDFRRSMEEVMEARARHGEKVDWGFMEELLFCYLRLNEKKHYRFVLDAFVDSVVDMRRNSGYDGGGGGAAEEEVTETWKKKKGKEMKEDN